MASRQVPRSQLLHSLCKRYQTNIAVARFNSTSGFSAPASSVKMGHHLPVYAELVANLRNHEGKAVSPKVSTKAFNEILANLVKDISEEDRKEIHWSSSYDPVTRSPFAKDVMHLQSLLDALLTSKNFDRADNILRAIYPLQDHGFVPLLNKYLEAYSSDASLEDLEKYLSSIHGQFEVKLNDRTYAILIAKAIQTGGDYMRWVNKAKQSRVMIRKTLNHVDLLSAEDLMKIFQDPSLQESHVPTDLIPLYKEAKSGEVTEDTDDSPEYFKTPDVQAPTVEKDALDLRSVDSFGLKIIRHSLMGLVTEETLNLDTLFKETSNENDEHLLHNTSTTEKRNYHDLYKTLQSDEDRAKFNEALDMFNEARQKRLELRGLDGAREKWKHEFDDIHHRGSIPLSKNLNAQLYKWYMDMLPLVEEEARLCEMLLDNTMKTTGMDAAEKKIWKERAFYAPYFLLIPPKKLCVITILELLKLNSTGGIADGMRAARAIISVGRALELEYKSQSVMKAEKKSLLRKKSSQQWRKILRLRKPAVDDPALNSDWDYPLHAKLGSVLTCFVIHVSKVQVTGTDPSTGETVKGLQPAFHHTYQFVQGQRLGIIRLHKNLVGLLAGNALTNSVQPQLLPMLVPPRDWTTHNSGGFIYGQSNLVRIKDSAETTAYVRAASDADNLDEVYKGLNVLGKTPWTVNAKVLNVISQCWNTGEAFLDIPPVVEEPELPARLPINAEPSAKAEYHRKLRKILNEAAAFRSQRCDTNYKLEIARAFVGEKMYFPHNLDFRGRAYPLAPHFNHLGGDLTRSLFLFWDGVELGKKGMDWLKIHLANVYGMDKAPLLARIAFVDENLDNIFDSAKNPLEGTRWWMKADKPWQALSVCFELNEAYKLDDCTKYVSYIPVHQDGTCNGLQHYAALGGDLEGARQVNLIPADKPQDVYKFVAGLVEKRLEAESEAGNKYATFFKGKMTRKIVKQTVMTNVYGVTFVGAVLQIEKQIKDLFTKENEDQIQLHSRYLTSLVFSSMRELFEGAHLIQDWLGESAKRISKSVRVDYEEKPSKKLNKPSHLSSVIWTTPLGLPCVQPYRNNRQQIVTTNLQDIVISDPFGATQVDARKQQSAFPPNFVHSLDATHMLMTAGACGNDGMAFASVHDSYWVHAASVDKMNVHIREQFVRLHEENLIVKLKEEFERRYKGFLQVMCIPTEHDVARKIKEVRRKIVKDLGRALTVADEIYVEKKRQELLASSDPKEVQMGREMVTTVSVTEDYDMNALALTTSTPKAFQVLVPLKFPEIPERGDLDVKVVHESPYFFS